jgi:hypothetical protein
MSAKSMDKKAAYFSPADFAYEGRDPRRFYRSPAMVSSGIVVGTGP